MTRLTDGHWIARKRSFTALTAPRQRPCERRVSPYHYWQLAGRRVRAARPAQCARGDPGSINHVKDSLQRINRRKERVSVGINPGLVGNDRSRLTFQEVPGLKRCAFHDKLVWHVVGVNPCHGCRQSNLQSCRFDHKANDRVTTAPAGTGVGLVSTRFPHRVPFRERLLRIYLRGNP